MADDNVPAERQAKLRTLFDAMMRKMFTEGGARFEVDLLATEEAQAFITEHADTLNDAFSATAMTDTMRWYLRKSNWVFSGMKAFHEMNEAFPSLLDADGNRKPFDQFLQEVRTIDERYNKHWLRAEYNFAAASAQMAAKWEQFAADGDRYHLQYRTMKDDKVRPAHAELDGVTRPQSDPFWETFYPPNGYNCRCTVVQVRPSRYPATEPEEAEARGNAALERDPKGMFRFNPGIEKQVWPDYNPYTIRRCKDCDKNAKLARGESFTPDTTVCAGCDIVTKCAGDKFKSARAIQRHHYLKEMEPLLQTSVQKTIRDDKSIKIVFNRNCTNHIYSDAVRSSTIKFEELKDLGKILERADYVGDAPRDVNKKHGKNNNYNHFYYFKAHVEQGDILLNIGEDIVRDANNGRIRSKYYCYSVTDAKKRAPKATP
jgi:SPP1 gp7 family putative phage head morphogenesis protein